MSTLNEDPSPFPEIPAPWSCRGEVFCLAGYTSPPKGSYPPPSTFPPLERTSSYADPTVTGQFKGGLNSILIIRYSETPVGPYDELIWFPGRFAVPLTDTEARRVGCMYVSSKETAYNGRKNWSIPKELAHFTFIPNSKKGKGCVPYTKVSVAPLSRPEKPFFVAEFTSTWLSRPVVLFSTSWIPGLMRMVNPPLPQSPNWREDGKVGTDRWWGAEPVIKGKVGVFRSKGGLEGGKYGDDVDFPGVRQLSLGIWSPDAVIECGVGHDVFERVQAEGMEHGNA